MNTSNLVKLCVFGADVGGRLSRLAKWVDGLPTSVKSLGFEIWATCEVLHELASILARSQRHGRRALFDVNALKDLHDAIEVCDEVFHEAARGVLVSYDRLRQLGHHGTGLEKSDESNRDIVYLSFQERTRWPLFQARVAAMMEVLIDAKMDITLHLLVYWVRWEGENRRRSRSSLFSTLTPSDRDALIAQLWDNKLRREPDTSSADDLHRRMPSQNTSNDSSAVASTLASSHSTSETTTELSPTSDVSTKSMNSLLKRLSRRLTKSSRRAFSFQKSGSKTKSEPLLEHYPNKDSLMSPRLKSPTDSTYREFTRAKSMSRSSSRSARTPGETSSTNNSLSGSYQVLGGQRYSLLGLTGGSQASIHHARSNSNGLDSLSPGATPATRPTGTLTKRASWSAGPTRSAKGGILREWEGLRSNGDDVLWQSEQPVDGVRNREQRSLGRKLLFAQLRAIIPANSKRDIEQQEAVIGMLVSRWTGLTGLGEKMPWESSPAIETAMELDTGNMEMKFHFRKAVTP